MTEIPETFIKWLHQQLDRTHFSQSEASRRAGLNQNAISDIVNGKTRTISINIAIGLGRVFGVPPEDVLRQAGVLPPLPQAVREEREVLTVLRSLSPEVRTAIVQMLCSFKGTSSPLQIPDQQSIISQPDLDSEISRFLTEYPEQKSIIEEARAYQLSDAAIRAIMANVRIVLSGPEERVSFSKFHKRLSELLEELARIA